MIGSDGGKTQSTVELDELRLVPGERVDVLVDFDGAPGEELQLRTLPLERGPGAPSHSEPIPLMTFLLTAETGVTDELPELGRDIDRFPTEAAEQSTSPSR